MGLQTLCDQLNRLFVDFYPVAPMPGTRGERALFEASVSGRRLMIAERVISGRKRDRTEKMRPIGFVAESDFRDLSDGVPGACGNLTCHAGKIAQIMLMLITGAGRADGEGGEGGEDYEDPSL